MNQLILNTGSSSLKLSIICSDSEETRLRGVCDWSSKPTQYQLSWDGGEIQEEVTWNSVGEAIQRALHDLDTHASPLSWQAVVHRVVHGGAHFTGPTLITEAVLDSLEALCDLAPMHNPASLSGIKSAMHAIPDLPHIAVFDTGFHSTITPEARTYPIPARWTESWGLRKYGFHGMSHAYCAQRAVELLEPASKELRLVIAHLGNGASVTAVKGGEAVDTSMGFTPLEGLMMGTRSGSVDPGLLLHVMTQYRLTPQEVEHALNHESGLLGVSGISADMRELLQLAAQGNERANLAIAMFVHRVRQSIGAMTVTMGGLDGLVFTGGIGEHSAEIRSQICDGLECLNLRVDESINSQVVEDGSIASDSSHPILVVTTREDLMMAREASSIL